MGSSSPPHPNQLVQLLSRCSGEPSTIIWSYFSSQMICGALMRVCQALHQFGYVNVRELTILSTRFDIDVLSVYRNLSSLNLKRCRLSGGDYQTLIAIPDLTKLSVVVRQAHEIKFLALLANITALDLDLLGKYDLSPLSTMTKLTSLTLLAQSTINLSRLSPSPSLTSISINSPWEIDISTVSQSIRFLSIKGAQGHKFLTLNTQLFLHRLDNFNLTDLHLIDTSITDLSGLTSCPSIRYLDLSGSPLLMNIDPLPSCRSLSTLIMQRMASLSDITPLSRIPSLTRLDMRASPHITSIDPIGACQRLVSLDVSRTSISDIKAISSLPDLNALFLQDKRHQAIQDLSPIGSCPHLLDLTLHSYSTDLDLGPIGRHCPRLERLDIIGCYCINLINVSWLSNCHRLRWIRLGRVERCRNRMPNFLSDISFVRGLTHLEHLDLSNNRLISDISPLSSCPNLLSLDLSGTIVHDLSPLASCSSLQSLNLNFTQVRDQAPLTSLTELRDISAQRPPVRSCRCRRAVKFCTIM